MPKRKPAPSAPVISLDTARQASAARKNSVPNIRESRDVCPFRMMELSLYTYYNLMLDELAILKARSKSVSSATKGE